MANSKNSPIQQRVKTIQKLADAGFTTDKAVLNFEMKDLVKLGANAASEITNIIELQEAIKNKTLYTWLVGGEAAAKAKKQQDIKDVLNTPPKDDELVEDDEENSAGHNEFYA